MQNEPKTSATPFIVAAGLVGAGGLGGLLFTAFFYMYPVTFDLGSRPMQAYGPALITMFGSLAGASLAMWCAWRGPRFRASGIGLAALGVVAAVGIGVAIFWLPTSVFMQR